MPYADTVCNRMNSAPEMLVDKGKSAPPLWKGFSWVFTGTLVYVVSQWGMLSILSKLGSPEVVGVFSLGLAITTPIILFAGMQLRQLQATDATNEYGFGEYMGLRVFTVALALTVIIAVVLVAGYSTETALIILVVAMAKTFETVSETFYGFLQKRERMEVVARSMMIKGPASLLSLGGTFYLTGSLLWAVVAMAVCWALVLIGYDARKCIPLLSAEKRRDSGGPANTGYLHQVGRMKQLAWLALPLGFAVSFNSLTVNVPRYLIDYYLTTHALGIFAGIAYIIISSRLLAGALGQSASPRLARYYSEGHRRAFLNLLLKLSLLSAAVGLLGVVVALFAGEWVLTLLYTPEYAEYVGLFVLVMVATALNYVASLLNFAMTAAGRLRSQTFIQAGVVAVTTISCVVLIPQAGVTGAGLALIMGKLFQLLAALGIVTQALGSLPATVSVTQGKVEH